MMLKDLTGMVFGRLTVISRAPNKETKTRSRTAWRCICSCGNETIATRDGLIQGHKRSCGCLSDQSRIYSNIKHGDTHHGRINRLFRIWSLMRDRCNNSNTPAYKQYGGRGISVCSQWQDYINFKSWAINNGYEQHLTIDRIDVNGNYCPQNCRWVTMLQQSHNKRNNKYITINGQTKCLAQWIRIYSPVYGIAYDTVRSRLLRGWDPVEALTKPKRKQTYFKKEK